MKYSFYKLNPDTHSCLNVFNVYFLLLNCCYLHVTLEGKLCQLDISN